MTKSFNWIELEEMETSGCVLIMIGEYEVISILISKSLPLSCFCQQDKECTWILIIFAVGKCPLIFS